MGPRYAWGVLHSIAFLDARALAGAATLARTHVGRLRAAFEVSLSGLPPHWGFFVGCGFDSLAGALERVTPTPGEVSEALTMGCIDEDFAERLDSTPWRLDIDAPEEGAVLFAGDAVATVVGPLWQAWLVASAIPAWIETSGVVATRAARLTLAAGKMGIIDASSCRMRDPEIATMVAGAAFVGGVRATQSPVAAGRLGIKLRVTKPPEALSLADEVALEQEPGWTFRSTGVGALTHLGPGHDEEETLADLQRHGIPTAEWAARGLASTAPGLGLRSDLVALEQQGAWAPRLGAIPDLTTIPGRKLVIRYLDRVGQPIADVMHGAAEHIQPPEQAVVVGHLGVGVSVRIVGAESAVPILRPLVRAGRRVGPDATLQAARDNLRRSLTDLPAAYTRLRHPAKYPVGVTPAIAQLKGELVWLFE